MTKFINIIKPSKGAIKPNKLAPFEVALKRLTLAKECVSRMAQSDNRATIDKEWNEFVGNLEGSWTAFFHDGKNLSSKFQPWAGKFDGQRKKDDLLNYLIQSRHIAQHAVIKLDWEKGKMHLRPEIDAPASFRDFKIFSDGSNEIEFKSDIPGNKPQVILEPGKSVLPQIYNAKYKQSILPPSIHMGQKIGSTSPIHVAKIAIGYYQRIYEEGSNLFLK